MIDQHNFGHIGRVVHLDHRAVVHVQMIDNARRRGDEIEIEFARETLGNDLQVQEAEEAAAETEAKCCGTLRFKRETGVVQAQPAHGLAQVFKVGGINREQTAEHNWLRLLETG